jgi:glyoxylase-like metal-dependent hydrolase (beta-lactamase superfamily II)
MTITRRTALATGLAGLSLPLLGAAQAPEYYRRRIGDIEVTIVADGIGYSPLEGLVINAPLPDVQQAMGEVFLPQDRFVTSYNTLIVNTGGKIVVFDTGFGDSGPPTAGRWLANFRAAGFDPATVDVVVLTHFHPDHINGYRMKDGTAVFPRAQTMAPAPEFAFWMDESKTSTGTKRTQDNARNVHRVLDPAAKDLTLFEWDREIVPGVTAIAAPGHTPGHTVFAIASGSESMLWMVDVTNNTDLLLRHPDWSPLFDVDPEKARETRHRLVDRAVADRMLVGFYHAPFPSTGHVVKDGAGYALIPVTWSPVL